jgi:hypothetical protein
MPTQLRRLLYPAMVDAVGADDADDAVAMPPATSENS